MKYGIMYCFFPSFLFILLYSALNLSNTSFAGFLIFFSTLGEMCSGATLSTPLTWCMQSSFMKLLSLSASI